MAEEAAGSASFIAGLQPDVARFIDHFIASVAELDVLAHLAKEPSRRASERDISRALAFAPAIVELWIDDLATKRLVARNDDGTLSYAPATVELARGVEMTLHAYRSRRVAVVAQIVMDPADDAEADASDDEQPARPAHPGVQLSDAFRLRKDTKP